MEAGIIEVTEFINGTNEIIKLHTPTKGHSGSDMNMMKDFVRIIGEGRKGKTNADISVESHLMALAAEEARLNDVVIDFKQYVNRCTE